MPSRKGMEQAMTWLRSKMAEGDTLDAINATVVYNVIVDLRKKKDQIGAIYHQTKVERDKALDELYSSTIEAFHKYAEKQEGGDTG